MNSVSRDEDEVVSVHAGFPNPAADMSLQGLSLDKLLIHHAASTYFFRIRGDEWQQAGIFDGDIAIIDRALSPQKSDVVLWWNSDDTEAGFHLSKLRTVPPAATVWGVVAASVHQFRQEH